MRHTASICLLQGSEHDVKQRQRDRLFNDDSYTSVTCALLVRGDDAAADDVGSYFRQILQQGDFSDPDPFASHDYACKDLNTHKHVQTFKVYLRNDSCRCASVRPTSVSLNQNINNYFLC